MSRESRPSSSLYYSNVIPLVLRTISWVVYAIYCKFRLRSKNDQNDYSSYQFRRIKGAILIKMRTWSPVYAEGSTANNLIIKPRLVLWTIVQSLVSLFICLVQSREFCGLREPQSPAVTYCGHCEIFASMAVDEDRPTILEGVRK